MTKYDEEGTPANLLTSSDLAWWFLIWLDISDWNWLDIFERFVVWTFVSCSKSSFALLSSEAEHFTIWCIFRCSRPALDMYTTTHRCLYKGIAAHHFTSHYTASYYCTYARTHIHTYTHSRIHAFTHTHTHKYRYIHTYPHEIHTYYILFHAQNAAHRIWSSFGPEFRWGKQTIYFTIYVEPNEMCQIVLWWIIA